MGGAMTLVIRPADAGDIEGMAVLEAAHQERPWTEGIFRDELAAENRRYFVADAGGLCGYGGVMVLEEEAHVTNLLVSEDTRGRGIGKALMVRLIEAALAMGARHLTLEVRSRNKVALTMYGAFGLAPVGLRKGYYGDDDALILWAHDIDSNDYKKRLEHLR